MIESIDEDSRKGGFQRIFPTPSTSRYLRFFDGPRYYNLFLDQWCQKYNKVEAKGKCYGEKRRDGGMGCEERGERGRGKERRMRGRREMTDER